MSEAAPFYAEIADAPEGASVYWCETQDKTRIRAAVWRGGTRGTVVLYTGRTEYIEKYGQVIHRLLDMGFCVATLDWRGQGLSDRPDGSTALGHVEDFQLYQLDMIAAGQALEAQNLPKPNILFAHSMGGCIGLRSLMLDLDFQAAVFSAPMWGLGLSPPMRIAAKIISRAADFLGRGKKHPPGSGPDFYTQVTEFDDNTLTSDPRQFARFQAHLSAHPELGLGGPSMTWLNAAFSELKALHMMKMPTLPVLTFLGGDEDIVDPDAVKSLMPKFPNGELVLCDGARHEIWMETPEIQAKVWEKTEAFLSAIAPKT